MISWTLAFFVASTLLAFGLAALVFLRRPDAAINRVFAFVLMVEGLSGLPDILALIWNTPASAHAAAYGDTLGRAAIALAYPLLLGFLDTPLAGVLRSRTTKRVLVGAFLAFAVVVYLVPVSAVADVTRSHEAYAFLGEWGRNQGWLRFFVYDVLFLGSLLFGLLVSIWAFRRASGTARRRAGAFLAAFGFRDASLAVATVGFAVSYARGDITTAARFDLLWAPAGFVFVAVLAYGVLREQILDIDLKIKLGISRGTVAAVIAVAALVGGEVLERLVGADALWASVAVGAVTALAFRPLARLGDRLADKALPGVEDTPQYRMQRAQELYSAALESAHQDGQVTAAERAVLRTLQRELALPVAEANRIERALLKG